MDAYETSWKERFKRVILSAGYSKDASDRIADEFHPQYFQDLVGYDKMLASYEIDHAQRRRT